MSDERPEIRTGVQQQLEALSRWENEGGAGPDGIPGEVQGLDRRDWTFVCRPVRAADAVDGVPDRRHHVSVARGGHRGQGAPLRVGDVVHIDHVPHHRRF